MTLARGPAPTGTPINVRIPDETLHQIDALADTTGTSRSDAFRTLIDEALMYRARKAARRGKK